MFLYHEPIGNMTNIDGKHSKKIYLHVPHGVKHKNTHKTGTEIIENILFFLRSTKY